MGWQFGVLVALAMVVVPSSVSAQTLVEDREASCRPVFALNECTTGYHVRTNGPVAMSIGVGLPNGVSTNGVIVNELVWRTGSLRMTCMMTSAGLECTSTGPIPPANTPFQHRCYDEGARFFWTCKVEYRGIL